MRGRLIVFSGIDGGGKSTQIQHLEARLAEAGHTSIILWTRGGYTSGINFLKSVVRRGSRSLASDRVPPPGPSAQRTRAFRRPLLRRIWLLLAILDLIRVYAITFRWQQFKGNTVLSDRYWQDTLLDFQLNFPTEKVESWWTWQLLTRVSPKPDLSILLVVPNEVSKERSLLKNEPFPTPDNILSERLNAYEKWGESDEWMLFDGQRPIDQIASEVEVLVQTHCDLLLEPSPMRAS